MRNRLVNLSACALLMLTLAVPALAEETKSEKSPEKITVELKTLNNSGESGTAVLTAVEDNKKTRVDITLTGEPADASQPAHIHVGACPTPGAVKWPLSPVVNGVSTTTIDASLGFLKSSLPLSVNVHKSAAEIGTYLACGNLPGKKVRLTKVEPACVKAAIVKRDAAITTALDVKYPALKAALTARTTALSAAWDMTDVKARATAFLKAWKDYMNATVKAGKDFKTARQAAWKAFRTDRQACGPATNAEDSGREGYDVQL